MGCTDCGPDARPKAPGWQAWIVVAAGILVIGFSMWRGATSPNRVLKLYRPTETLAFSTDGKKLIAIGGGRALAWDIETWNELPPGVTLPVPVDPASSPDGKRRAVAGHAAERPEIRVLDVMTGQPVVKKELKSRISGGVVQAVALGPRWLAAAFGNGERSEIFLWDVSK